MLKSTGTQKKLLCHYSWLSGELEPAFLEPQSARLQRAPVPVQLQWSATRGASLPLAVPLISLCGVLGRGWQSYPHVPQLWTPGLVPVRTRWQTGGDVCKAVPGRCLRSLQTNQLPTKQWRVPGNYLDFLVQHKIDSQFIGYTRNGTKA